MDDPDKMDLALNADFDSSLLSCWDGSASTSKNDGKTGGSGGSTSSTGGGGGVNWDRSSSPRFSRLPSFTMEEDSQLDGGIKRMSTGTEHNALDGNAASNTSQQHAWMSSSGQSTAAVTDENDSVGDAKKAAEREATNNPTANPAQKDQINNLQANHLSHGTLQSATEVSNTTGTQMHPLAIPSSANCPPHVVTTAAQQTEQAQMQAVMGLQNALYPVALTTTGGSSAAYAAGLPMTNTTTNQGSNDQIQHQQQADKGQQMQNNPAFFLSSLQQQLQASQSQQQQQQQQNAGNDGINNNGTQAATTTPPPPFYLFDAPVELRLNFMQSQRMHGLPVTEDSNSYHYGVAVNGFHPQLTGQPNSVTGAGLTTATNSGSHNHYSSYSSSVQLVDARHGSRKAGRIKNEREQRRAQKITELIDQLREKMETGGWKVEVKSKFHTLSSCADYVKHLIKETNDKEEAVNKAKSDLQMKERKVEEEKALQEPRSDPESVMSSLTSSSGDSSGTSNHHNTKKVSSEGSSTDEGQRKRKSSSGGTSSNKKSRKAINSEHSGSSESSSGDSQQHKRQCLDKGTFSVSDITESNKGSSNSGNEDSQNSNQRSDDDDASGTPSSITASSSAAVVQRRDRMKHSTNHADVVIKERKERNGRVHEEVTSLEDSFILDYEEVFVKSNVPQIIATTAGRIVAYNEFFLKATGLSKAGVKGLTIFSLVKQEKLSNLFEIVAKALRRGTPSTGSSSEGSSKSGEPSKWEYAAMTLPCMEFPSSKEKSTSGNGWANPLYITVTLMADEDPRKRLFHCVFTDCPGTNGALGSITPELLALLFTRHRKIDPSAPRNG